jgi:hypothetical protein
MLFIQLIQILLSNGSFFTRNEAHTLGPKVLWIFLVYLLGPTIVPIDKITPLPDETPLDIEAKKWTVNTKTMFYALFLVLYFYNLV